MLERIAYLNTGTFGPLPRRTVEAMAARQRRDLERGRSGHAYFDELLALWERLRTVFASFLGAPAGSIALTRSTTDGCNIVVSGLGLGPDDEILTTDVEHPGLRGALEVSAARLREVRLRGRTAADALAALEAAITPRTRLIALSHVAWTTGAVLPIRELAGRGIPLLVDGAQAAGAMPVNVAELGCDFYAVSGQKWLLGPDATGCLYVRPGRIEDVKLTSPSYMSWERGTYTPRRDVGRFEAGWIATAAIEGLLASIEFAEGVGDERFERARALAERSRELLAERAEVVTEPGQATLVTFKPREPAAEVVRRLEERGVVVRDLPGGGRLRAS